MESDALKAGVRAVTTFLEAEFPGHDVVRLEAPPGGAAPADAQYFRLEDEDGALAIVGATAALLGGLSSTDLVEQLHLDDLGAAIRAAGPGACVVVDKGVKPRVVSR